MYKSHHFLSNVGLCHYDWGNENQTSWRSFSKTKADNVYCKQSDFSYLYQKQNAIAVAKTNTIIVARLY